MVLPVRVRLVGAKTSELAHTLDGSEIGVRLGGFRGEPNVGDIIEIQYRHQHAMFRIVWIRTQEDSSKHLGAECIERDKNMWGQEFPDQLDEYEEKES
jgi:hypothetical protein